MKPFQRVQASPESIEAIRATLVTRFPNQIVDSIVAEVLQDEIYQNDVYQVSVRKFMNEVVETPMIHLSIRRLDREIIRDWRDLQQIKNELAGTECEAVELFPAESRLVDTSNQYHLWCFADTTIRFPLGWNERLVSWENALPDLPNVKQREKTDATV